MRVELLLLLAIGLCDSVANAGASITAVDDANFDSTVVQALEAWVVEFYSPRCGTCAELAPLYEALAQRHSHRVHFGGVDIDTEAGMALAQRLDVLSHGVPAILSYTQLGSQHSNTVFSGWQIPTLEQLEKNLLAAVHPGGGAQDDAAEGERIMKT